MSSKYISGHHPSVLSSHSWRTAENSAAYLLPHLQALLNTLQTTRPSTPPTLLDLGCGPGTITLDFAVLLAPYDGYVTGIDPSADVVAQARAAASERGITNVTFATGDALALAFGAGAFDVTHAHQVLQHVGDPVGMLREMRRVTAAGGIVATRETDFSAMAWWPLIPGVDEWRRTWQRVCAEDGNDADTGRKLVKLALEAGFERARIQASAGAWCYSSPEEVKWWGESWQERVIKSDFAKKVVQGGFGTAEDLERMREAWKEWQTSEDAWFGLLHGEITCWN